MAQNQTLKAFSPLSKAVGWTGYKDTTYANQPFQLLTTQQGVTRTNMLTIKHKQE